MLLTTLKIVQLIPLSAGCLALNFHICFELLGSALLPPPPAPSTDLLEM